VIEIKFRVWDNNNNEMLTDKPGRGRVTEILLNYHMGLLKDNPFSFMQNTGLKDKNGVEIYEGDITEFYIDFGYGEQKITAEVVFEDCGFKYKSEAGIDYIRDFNNVEVIGNIYENKELLDGK